MTYSPLSSGLARLQRKRSCRDPDPCDAAVASPAASGTTVAEAAPTPARRSPPPRSIEGDVAQTRTTRIAHARAGCRLATPPSTTGLGSSQRVRLVFERRAAACLAVASKPPDLAARPMARLQIEAPGRDSQAKGSMAFSRWRGSARAEPRSLSFRPGGRRRREREQPQAGIAALPLDGGSGAAEQAGERHPPQSRRVRHGQMEGGAGG